MTAEELQELIEQLRITGTDCAKVEVKSSQHKISASLRETISAFSNGNGGTIILGLSEEQNFEPILGFNAKNAQDALVRMCKEDLTPSVHPDIDLIALGDATVVVAIIPALIPRQKPCYVTSKGMYGGSYVRSGDADHKLRAYEIDRLLENRGQPDWDRELVANATIADLDEKLVAGLLDREKAQAPRIFGQKDDIDALQALGVLTKDKQGVLRPSLAGLLALGTYPQHFFPRLYVSFALYPGSDKTSDVDGIRFLDSITFMGPIPDIVRDVVERVVSKMRIGGVIQGAFRKDLPDYPPVAVREAVTNALMHRDYSPDSRGAQVQVNMFVDRLEIVNPGGLFGAVTVETLTAGEAIPSSRNALLSRLLESVPYPKGYVAENRGSGYREIERQLSENLLPAPIPNDRLTQFSLTFRRREMTSAERGAATGTSSSDQILAYLDKHRTATSRELAAAAGIGVGGVRKAISILIDEGLIERTQPVRSPKQRYRKVTNRDGIQSVEI